MQVDQEQEQTLASFREDILKALAQLQVKLIALERAILEPRITQKRLQELRKEARGSFEKIHERYARTVGPAHTRRVE
jgi:hypothetical protein